MKMKMKKLNTASRAWNILRLAILWARKGGVSRRRFMINFPKYIKSFRHQTPHHHRGAIGYGERQLSFDETPVVHVRMHRPSSLRFKLPTIPCINPAQVDFDFDFNDYADDVYYNNVARKSFLKSAEDEDEDSGEEYYGNQNREVCEDVKLDEEDQGIDMKAEEFIAKFYEQMKLQRQISYLQYHDKHLTTDKKID